MYACVYAPGYPAPPASVLTAVAQQFSPRYETHRDLAVIDVRGLDRLFGSAQTIGDELRREASDRGLRVHVAIASTQTAATVLAIACPGVVAIEPGDEAAAVARLPIDLLGNLHCDNQRGDRNDRGEHGVAQSSAISAIAVFKRWGLRSLGD